MPENAALPPDPSGEAVTCPGAPLFIEPGHYYSPVVDPAAAAAALDSLARGPAPRTLPDVYIDRAAMIRLWRGLLPDLRDAPFPRRKSEGFAFYFDNPAYSWGDALMYYAFLRRWRPRRVIEVGAGYSSALLLDTLARDWPDGCEVTFVDPHPQVIRELFGSALDESRLIASSVQDCPVEVFTALEAGDFLFIDSTHVLKTGSDVCHELFRILPALAPGVIVHFHDMFWPFEYPRAWVVDDNRSWNELYAIRAFLNGNAGYEVLMFNDYLAKTERPLVAETCPRFLWNPGGALWLRKSTRLSATRLRLRRLMASRRGDGG